DYEQAQHLANRGKINQSLYHLFFGKVYQEVQELPIDSLCHSYIRLSGKGWDSISATLYDTPVISLFSFSPSMIN
ncbi:hypothetical protein, partial [Prevotella sp.]|uniref:hypothetical protein n=1 Tax=Prevotella sp. TaxID=59823 RepID=UPI0027E29B9B